MKLFKKTIGVLATVLLISLVAIPNHAYAKDEIDVKYVTGKKLSDQKVVSEKNIYPGWSEQRKVRVQNESETDTVDLYIKFKDVSGKKLAGKIKIYVIRNDGSYRLGGTGDHWTLKKASGKNFYIDKLDPQESKHYKIKFVFDKNAGNEYQDISSKFDVRLKIEGEKSTTSEEEILISQERSTFTGEPPADEPGEEIESEESPATQEGSGEILGVSDSEEPKDQCQSWPLIKWVLALIAYLGILNFNNFYRVEFDQRVRWFWQLIFTILIVVVWTIFDECRLYTWFPTVSIFTGLASYMLYLGKIGAKFKQ
jgi:hypothetical protein